MSEKSPIELEGIKEIEEMVRNQTLAEVLKIIHQKDADCGNHNCFCALKIKRKILEEIKNLKEQSK